MGRRYPILMLFSLLIGTSAGGATLFESDDILDVQLSGPLSTLRSSKKNKVEMPFVLTVNNRSHQVHVRLRGKSRLKICSFPPLRLKFSAGDTTGSPFAEQEKLKLVTHCRRNRAAQTDMLQEYAAYRIFNVLSNVSYRVRLMRIHYVDDQQPDKSLQRYGFVIESRDGLAERLGGVPAKIPGVSLASLQQEHMSAVYLFHYLIGNTDWSLVPGEGETVCCHNGDLLDTEAGRHLVPYDFDLAGLVNARYAYPDPSLRIRKVTQRLYRGFCLPKEALLRSLKKVRSKKNNVLSLLRALPEVSDREMASSINFVNSFFTQAQDVEKMLGRFERQCL